MPTIPTGKMERELRALYLRWLRGVSLDSENINGKVDEFQRSSQALIEREGGRVAFRGAIAGFPAPKVLDLSPHTGTIYSDMKQAAIQAGIAAGMQSTDIARQIFRLGMDKSFNRLNRLARTETVSAYWKNAFDSAADLPDIVMVWGAEDGPRTCQWCKERDGMVMDSPNLRDHPNGRCTPIPTHRSLVEYKGSVGSDGRIYHDPAWDGQSTPEVPPGVQWKPTMTQAEADTWAADSVINQTMLHGTTPEAADAIRREGFNLGEEKWGRMNGNGVYVTENEGTAFMYERGATLPIRVNVKNPVDINDLWADPRFLEVLDEVKELGLSLTAETAEAITRYAQRYNFDAIIKRDSMGRIDELIVINPQDVTVVA